MGASVCPIAVIAAPVERVWSLVVDPAQWANWADATLEHADPPGAATPGQTFTVSSVGFGRRWQFQFSVGAVDGADHRLLIRADFPFGMVEHVQIRCVPIDEGTCRVAFG